MPFDTSIRGDERFLFFGDFVIARRNDEIHFIEVSTDTSFLIIDQPVTMSPGEVWAFVEGKLTEISSLVGGGGVIGDTSFTSLGATPTIALSTDTNISKQILKRTMDANVTSFDFSGGIEGTLYELHIQVDVSGPYTFTGATGIKTKGGIDFVIEGKESSLHIFYVRKLHDGSYFVESNYFIE